MTTAETAHSRALTVGVEEEFLLVDAEGHLAFLGPEVLHTTSGGTGRLHQEIARCQVESASPVCHTAGGLLTELRRSRLSLAEAAHDMGLRLIGTGTPVLAEDGPVPLSPDLRYQRMADHFGVLISQGNACGCHVHVSMADAETALRVSNRLREWLPVLLALTANSPFDNGADTGYASWRHLLWSRWPSASPPPIFDSPAHYEASVRALLASEAALDRGMVYWDIRLSENHPTLETRICDVAATAEEATLAAVLIRGLVSASLADIETGRPPLPLPSEVLRGHIWRAARDGLEGRCLDPLAGSLVPAHAAVERLIEHIRPFLGELDDLDFAESTVAALRRLGGGAWRQRAAFARRERLTDVVDYLAETTVRGTLRQAAVPTEPAGGATPPSVPPPRPHGGTDGQV